jgi:hypothetical protein
MPEVRQGTQAPCAPGWQGTASPTLPSFDNELITATVSHYHQVKGLRSGVSALLSGRDLFPPKLWPQGEQGVRGSKGKQGDSMTEDQFKGESGSFVFTRSGCLGAVLATAVWAFSLLATQAGTPEVIASGLNNPRGLAFGPEGALYVAEAGAGGAGPSIPGPDNAPVYFGNSGSITRIYKGTQTRIVTGLPSLAPSNAFRAIGPNDISFQGRGNMYVSFGLGGDPAKLEPLGEDGDLFGKVIRLQPSGHWREAADIAAYEAVVNPGGLAIDSNPYSLCAEPGFTAVVDAGGNALLRIQANGTISTVAVFPSRMVPAPPFLGLPPGAMIPMQSVPDCVAKGPDGAYYVGELTGFPFVPGAARVFRVVPGQSPQAVLEGFTNIMDVDFGPDGSLYVLQHDDNGLLVPGNTASLIRVQPGGTRAAVTSTLDNPTSVAIGPDGAAYVSNRGVHATIGEVLRIPIP